MTLLRFLNLLLFRHHLLHAVTPRLLPLNLVEGYGEVVDALHRQFVGRAESLEQGDL